MSVRNTVLSVPSYLWVSSDWYSCQPVYITEVIMEFRVVTDPDIAIRQELRSKLNACITILDRARLRLLLIPVFGMSELSPIYEQYLDYIISNKPIIRYYHRGKHRKQLRNKISYEGFVKRR